MVTKGTIIGHEIAADEINEKGGLLGGRKIKFVVRDNKLKPGIAVKEFRRMVTRDKVDFVMGVISSGVALAVSQVAKEMKVLFVDTIAQTAALTGEQGHHWVVRTDAGVGRTLSDPADLHRRMALWPMADDGFPLYGAEANPDVEKRESTPRARLGGAGCRDVVRSAPDARPAAGLPAGVRRVALARA